MSQKKKRSSENSVELFFFVCNIYPEPRIFCFRIIRARGENTYNHVKNVTRLCFGGNEILRASITLPHSNEQNALCDLCGRLGENALLWCEKIEYKRLCASFDKAISRYDYDLSIKATEKGDGKSEVYICATYKKSGEKYGISFKKRLLWSHRHNAFISERKNDTR